MIRADVRRLLVENRLEVAWVGFACLNLMAMLALITNNGPHGWETVPFHLIYVSFTLLYGYRMWRGKGTIAGITFVSLSAGGMTLFAVHRSREDWAELTEVPLMGLMFLAMVYHVRRRQDAVAESQRLASNLRASLQRQRDFVSNASHDLLTPLTIARGHVDLLRRYHSADHDEIAAISDTVVAELERMERLIDQLLLIEGAPTPGFLVPAETGLAQFLEELVQRWRLSSPRDWALARIPDIAVVVDRDRLAICLDELLENAVRHTKEGDRISVGAVAAPRPRAADRSRLRQGHPGGRAGARVRAVLPGGRRSQPPRWRRRPGTVDRARGGGGPRRLRSRSPASPARAPPSPSSCRPAQPARSRYPPPRTVSIRTTGCSLRRSRPT